MDFTLDYSNYILPTCSGEVLCIALVVINAVIFLLGIVGNGVVICITGLKIKKSVNTTWYLSLAVSDFLLCFFLLFNVFYMATSDWTFEIFICKFMSFIMLLNMFSSIFLLVIISAVHCGAVMVPMWAQNQRTIIMLAWIVSALLSTPSAIYRNIKDDHMTSIKTIMTVLILCFFICWFPFHTVAFMEPDAKYYSLVPTGQKIAATLLTANSFMNPFLYALMGKDFKRTFYAVLSKIECAIKEERRSTVRGTSITNSGEGRLSTTV
uniref:G-protein coupled receptors family 1 profile domain-containing protein n=1 Tax=Electrophorus electricus TaxID=8005 RepID=A0A4W4DZD1_ELEEL